MKNVRRSILVGVLAVILGVLVACTPSGGGASNAPAAAGSAAPPSAAPAPSTAGGYGY